MDACRPIVHEYVVEEVPQFHHGGVTLEFGESSRSGPNQRVVSVGM